MKTMMKKCSLIMMLALILAAFAVPVCAGAQEADTAVEEAVEEDEDSSVTGTKAIAAAITIALASAAGALGMGLAISKSVEGISRQPEAAGSIQTNLMLGLVFVETAIIYALIVAILIIFVL